MTLEEFAKRAGVSIVRCHKSWGGEFAYTTKDAPNVQVCGFRTARAAYNRWLQDTFGEQAGKAVLRLLKTR